MHFLKTSVYYPAENSVHWVQLFNNAIAFIEQTLALAVHWTNLVGRDRFFFQMHINTLVMLSNPNKQLTPVVSWSPIITSAPGGAGGHFSYTDFYVRE